MERIKVHKITLVQWRSKHLQILTKLRNRDNIWILLNCIIFDAEIIKIQFIC